MAAATAILTLAVVYLAIGIVVGVAFVAGGVGRVMPDTGSVSMGARILNGAAGISADMSLRLSAALGSHESLWYELQMSYDLWQASRKKRPQIERFNVAA